MDKILEQVEENIVGAYDNDTIEFIINYLQKRVRETKKILEENETYTKESFIEEFLKLDTEKTWTLEEIDTLYDMQMDIYGTVDIENTSIEYAIKNKDKIVY